MAPDPGSDSQVGVRIGPYCVTRELGRGGMSVVYEARHESIGQLVAVKVLPARRANEERYLRRLYDEARAVSLIAHEGLVKIFDFGVLPGGPAYILMEYLRGETLRERLRQAAAALGADEALRLARQMAAALAAAHEQGVVHRDLKPDNVMLIPDAAVPGGRRAKLLDFGIAKLPDGHTTPGTILGTTLYMAPEQCLGSEYVDERADVYALGVMLYEMLAGRLPFVGTRLLVLEMHLYQAPPPLRELSTAVPDALAELVEAMLAKEPAARPAMREVAARLLAIEQPGAAAQDPGPPVPPQVLDAASALAAALAPTATAEFAGPPSPLPAPVAAGAPLDERPRPSWWRRGVPWVYGAAVVLALGGGGWWYRVSRAPGRTGHLRATPAGMVLIPGGAFPMGSSDDDVEQAYRRAVQQGCGDCRREAYEHEQPRRQVRVSPFYLDRTEVTNQPFAAWLNQRLRDGSAQVVEDPPGEKQVRGGGVLLVNLSAHKDAGGLLLQGGRVVVRLGQEQHPVTQLSWYAALGYCQARGGRLPSEAEWEYAARGPAGTRFPWGDAAPRCDGVVFGQRENLPCAGRGHGPEAVGTAAQDVSPQGVRDLAGNVAEWVMDRFTARYQRCADAACVDPMAPAGPEAEEPELRVVRGGAWHRAAESGRGAARSRRQADSVTGDIGFRCVLPALDQDPGRAVRAAYLSSSVGLTASISSRSCLR